MPISSAAKFSVKFCCSVLTCAQPISKSSLQRIYIGLTQPMYSGTIADDEFATGVLLCMNVLRNSTKVDDTRRYISQFLEPTISTERLRQFRESTHTTFLRATLYTAWGRPGPPQFMKFFPAQPCHMYCKVVRLDSRVRWSGGLSFRELTVVNARCSQQLCFTTLITMGMTSIGL